MSDTFACGHPRVPENIQRNGANGAIRCRTCKFAAYPKYEQVTQPSAETAASESVSAHQRASMETCNRDFMARMWKVHRRILEHAERCGRHVVRP